MTPTSGTEINKLLMIVLLFADDMVILGNSQSDLQCRLNLLKEYCDKWGGVTGEFRKNQGNGIP